MAVSLRALRVLISIASVWTSLFLLYIWLPRSKLWTDLTRRISLAFIHYRINQYGMLVHPTGYLSDTVEPQMFYGVKVNNRTAEFFDSVPALARLTPQTWGSWIEVLKTTLPPLKVMYLPLLNAGRHGADDTGVQGAIAEIRERCQRSKDWVFGQFCTELLPSLIAGSASPHLTVVINVHEADFILVERYQKMLQPVNRRRRREDHLRFELEDLYEQWTPEVQEAFLHRPQDFFFTLASGGASVETATWSTTQSRHLTPMSLGLFAVEGTKLRLLAKNNTINHVVIPGYIKRDELRFISRQRRAVERRRHSVSRTNHRTYLMVYCGSFKRSAERSFIRSLKLVSTQREAQQQWQGSQPDLRGFYADIRKKHKFKDKDAGEWIFVAKSCRRKATARMHLLPWHHVLLRIPLASLRHGALNRLRRPHTPGPLARFALRLRHFLWGSRWARAQAVMLLEMLDRVREDEREKLPTRQAWLRCMAPYMGVRRWVELLVLEMRILKAQRQTGRPVDELLRDNARRLDA
ncbi:unnamed protein product [Vitrella brassicaformis CCMP3155]|uniref:Uncharacterized protein n=1 Tax=Vitrella brassicaformis (strain CCMP3155) TaxID=1169540 RepID=A0A0G4H104_VITBC|nr:unnamed protein product [Vitrella brassicaformis CCMP3155]|eukprot:CEM37060.1 unnamed protein product [Vitrella brassicaformis CCMP3155]